MRALWNFRLRGQQQSGLHVVCMILCTEPSVWISRVSGSESKRWEVMSASKFELRNVREKWVLLSLQCPMSPMHSPVWLQHQQSLRLLVIVILSLLRLWTPCKASSNGKASNLSWTACPDGSVCERGATGLWLYVSQKPSDSGCLDFEMCLFRWEFCVALLYSVVLQKPTSDIFCCLWTYLCSKSRLQRFIQVEVRRGRS